jgi:ribosomal protein L11 methyltransferase
LRNAVALEVVDAHEGFPGAGRITIANILANALRMLAPTIASHTRPGGAIVLCGVLESQCEEVVRAYAPWAQLDIAGREGDWVLLVGERSC